MYAVFYAKPIINRYCQSSSYFMSMAFAHRRVSTLRNGLPVSTSTRFGKQWQNRTVSICSEQSSLLALLNVARLTEVGVVAAAAIKSGPRRPCSRAGEGVAGDQIPLDTNSIKPAAARRTRSLSGSGGLLAATSENL